MRVSYLDAALLNLPECEWEYVIMFNTDARLYMCGPHHRFWEKYYQSHDSYEFGTLAAPQTLVEWVCEYMQRKGL